MKKYDIIVIGGGGGTKFVGPAREMGLSIAIVEKEDLGGTCLNRGCIPSKMLIHPANVLTAARNMEKYSIKGCEDISVDFDQLVTRVTEIVVGESQGIHEKYNDADDIDFYHGHAFFKSDKVIGVRCEVEGGEEEEKEITADKIFIATGSHPSVPPIPGLEGTPYMTSREALRNTKLPEKLLVIGGGYIAVELGHAYSALGSETTFFVRGKYMEREDGDVQQEFAKSFEGRHKTVYGTQDLTVSYEDGIFTLTGKNPDGSDVSESGDALLLATGVKPSTADLGLENTGIQMNERGYIQVNDHLETSVSGVYALGDCVGNYLFRHSVNFEAEYLVESVLEGSNKAINYPPMPHAVFTHPEIAGVGPTEEELKESCVPYRAFIHRYENSAQGMARLPEEGLVKMMFDPETKKLLSCHIIGDEASIMIHQFILALTMDATVDDLLKMIYIHPALPEVARNAVRKAKRELG